MHFPVTNRTTRLYGCGRCVCHTMKKHKEEELREEEGGRHEAQKVVEHKPQLDKVIKRLSNLEMKKRKVVFK